jgi:hypothetical protein
LSINIRLFPLADAYQAIGYCLCNDALLADYLKARNESGDEIRTSNESRWPSGGSHPITGPAAAAGVLQWLPTKSFSNDILRALFRMNCDLGIVRKQDLWLTGASDELVVARAADHSRVLLTHDVSMLQDMLIAAS